MTTGIAKPPFERILLATEGGEFDVGAERLAIALAARYGLPLMTVLVLVSNPEYASLAPELQQQAEAEAVAKLSRLRETARSSSVELVGTIRMGEQPFREIVDEARERSADLIVVRRRGKRGYLANLLLGEMVYRVIGHAPCDVLIVPRTAQLWSHTIILATDCLPHSDRAAALAAAVAVRDGLPLTVVSVQEQGRGDAAERVQAVLVAVRTAGARADGSAVAEGRPHEAILAAAQQASSDLIVLGRRSVNPLQRVLLGSTSSRVVGAANSAVLIAQQTIAAPDQPT